MCPISSTPWTSLSCPATAKGCPWPFGGHGGRQAGGRHRGGGGTPEVVTDGDNGLLIPPRDAGALAAALERLLTDPAFAQRLGANARAHVREHFSLDRLGREINEIYGELVREEVCTLKFSWREPWSVF